MDILRRSLAPLSENAWEEISGWAKTCLQQNLSARKFVAVSGPHGWEHAAVNLGRLEIQESNPIEGLCWGMREVLPLLEVRLPFMLSQMEMDCIDRGNADPDLQALEMAAYKVANFEEQCIYLGFEEAGIVGMKQASPHEPVELPKDIGKYPEAVAHGVSVIRQSGVGGPFALVLGREPYEKILAGKGQAYPLNKRIEDILAGKIYCSPAFEEEGMLLSTVSGNFELTLGQDFSIGYAGHDRKFVELYIAESFTFRVLEPRACAPCRML